MKAALGCFFLSVTLSVTAVRGDEDSNYEIRPIKSLDDIQGHWAFVPKGEGGYEGLVLDIRGKQAVYTTVTDTPPAKHGPTKVDLKLVDGVLVLKTDAAHVENRHWHLLQRGEYRCLLAFNTLARPGLQPHLVTETLYFHAPVDKLKPVSGDFLKRNPKANIRPRSRISN